REGESHRISGSSFSSRSCRWISSSSRSARTRHCFNFRLHACSLLFICEIFFKKNKQKIRALRLTAHGVSVEAGRTFYRSGGCVIILRPPSFFR
ncbi:unnamed protein product, partial [Brassica oleracea]